MVWKLVPKNWNPWATRWRKPRDPMMSSRGIAACDRQTDRQTVGRTNGAACAAERD